MQYYNVNIYAVIVYSIWCTVSCRVVWLWFDKCGPFCGNDDSSRWWIAQKLRSCNLPSFLRRTIYQTWDIKIFFLQFYKIMHTLYISCLIFRLDQCRSFTDINSNTENLQRWHRNVHITRKDIIQYISSFRIFGSYLWIW